MQDYNEDFDQVKKAFAENFNLDPNYQDNVGDLLKFYYAHSLNKTVEANKPRPVRYRREDVPQAMMRMDDLRDAGTEKDGLYHRVVDGITVVGEDDERQELPYSYGLIEDIETGNFYTVDLELIRFV